MVAMQPEKGNSDIRRRALDQWVGDWLGAPVSGDVASADASFRRYFRYRHGGRTLVAMDAPPEQEDCRPFVDVAGRLARAGVAVPEILHQDLEQGFLLLTDMGRETWLTALDGGNADAWFDAALETLITQQRFADTRGLPKYDRALLRRELDLFPHWYLGEHRGRAKRPEDEYVCEQGPDDCAEHAEDQCQLHRGGVGLTPEFQCADGQDETAVGAQCGDEIDRVEADGALREVDDAGGGIDAHEGRREHRIDGTGG